MRNGIISLFFRQVKKFQEEHKNAAWYNPCGGLQLGESNTRVLFFGKKIKKPRRIQVKLPSTITDKDTKNEGVDF
jgi:hypothetical protein